LQLNKLYVSPKIINFFEKIKAEVRDETPEQGNFVRYIIVKDKRLEAAKRSLVFPGWGQIYKGEKKKGMVLAAAWTISLGSLLFTHLAQGKAHQDYLDARNPDDIESNYQRYDDLYRARNSIAIFSIGIWLYAHIDAALKKTSDYPPKVQVLQK